MLYLVVHVMLATQARLLGLRRHRTTQAVVIVQQIMLLLVVHVLRVRRV